MLCTASVPADALLRHEVVRIIDQVEVVAATASHAVGAGHSVQLVVGSVADQAIGKRIAGAVDRSLPGQDQVFDISAKREAGSN